MESGALKFDIKNYFVWSSGHRMPVYNDTRLLLGDYDTRMMVSEGFQDTIREKQIKYDMIFGVATAGISPATTLADSLKAPLGYVRSTPKGYGLGKAVEGPDPSGKKTLVVEELISTGKSAARAISELRKSGARVNHCLSIFNYSFYISQRIFNCMETFDDDVLEEPCTVTSLVYWDTLIDVAAEMKYVSDTQIGLLRKWKKDPFNK